MMIVQVGCFYRSKEQVVPIAHLTTCIDFFGGEECLIIELCPIDL
jgi:hypothetical protein